MGFWGIAKKVINSTVGTSNFQPLDKLIGIKSVQRGTTSASGYVTIGSVNMAKSYVISVSKGSEGTVAARGSIVFSSLSLNSGGVSSTSGNPAYANGVTISVPGQTLQINGGTTSLTVKQFSATLYSSTSIYCDGPVEWQVIEYN